MAALVVNLVLLAYIVAAFMEDQGEGSAKTKKAATREELQERLRKMDEDDLSKKVK